MKILFIGNSYTFYNDMPKMLEALSIENGKDVEVYSVTKGGRKLYSNLNEGDEWGEKIRDLCAKNEFDVLFLQEQSYFPIVDEKNITEGARALKELVNAKRTILYSTWGRSEGCPLLDELSLSSSEMSLALRDAYRRAAADIGAELSEVGMAFEEIKKGAKNISLYANDLSHPSYIGSAVAALVHYRVVFGDLPSSTASIEADDGTMTTILNILT